MPRKPNGDRAMTAAQRNAALRIRKAETEARTREALRRITTARTAAEARAIAAAALADGR